MGVEDDASHMYASNHRRMRIGSSHHTVIALFINATAS